MSERDDGNLTAKIATQLELLDAEAMSESRDVSVLARAGPCAGNENLITLAMLSSKGTGFWTCTSQEQIKKHLESIMPGKELIQTLISACKASVNDLHAVKLEKGIRSSLCCGFQGVRGA